MELIVGTYGPRLWLLELGVATFDVLQRLPADRCIWSGRFNTMPCSVSPFTGSRTVGRQVRDQYDYSRIIVTFASYDD